MLLVASTVMPIDITLSSLGVRPPRPGCRCRLRAPLVANSQKIPCERFERKVWPDNCAALIELKDYRFPRSHQHCHFVPSGRHAGDLRVTIPGPLHPVALRVADRRATRNLRSRRPTAPRRPWHSEQTRADNQYPTETRSSTCKQHCLAPVNEPVHVFIYSVDTKRNFVFHVDVA